MTDIKQPTEPFRDPDGIVHATYQTALDANHHTNCGFQCVLYLFKTDGSAAGKYQEPDQVITCLVCLGGGERKCDKCNGQGLHLRACPFDVEIHNPHTPACHCCAGCVQGCADDV